MDSVMMVYFEIDLAGADLENCLLNRAVSELKK